MLDDDISLCVIVNKEENEAAGSHNLHSPVTEPITAENPQYSQGFTVKGDNSTSPPVEESSNTLPVRENSTSSHVEEQSTYSPVEDNFTHSPVEEDFKPSPVEENSTSSHIEESSNPLPVKENSTSSTSAFSSTTSLVEENSTHSPVEEHFTPSPVEENFKPSSVEEEFNPPPVEDNSTPSRIKENSIVYPTSGKLEGKECIVGTIQANGTYWVRRNNNQPANSPIAYTRSQLSITSPKSETSSEEGVNIAKLSPGAR